jgi:RHS repeat-associated protein
VIRMNYADHPSLASTTSYHAWPEPFAIVPHWDLRGQAQSGTYGDTGARWRCMTKSGESERCVALDWSAGWFPYRPARPVFESWHGSMIEGKRDGSGLLYRRNRYYDPGSGRFTQEDPIGLAGGLNLYGYAGGDPVNFWDPFGLNPCEQSSAWTDCLALAIANWGGENGNTAARVLGAALSGVLEATGINALATAGDHIGNGRFLRGSGEAGVLLLGGKIAQAVGGTVAGLFRSRGADRIERVVAMAQEWLGDGAQVITNRAGDKIFLSENGTRRIRFDINRPHPHVNPHAHVEELVNGRWVGGRRYPVDVEPR